MTNETPTMPLTFDPWYLDKLSVLDWLNQDDGRPLIFDMPRRLEPATDITSMELELDRITLQKRKAWGPAPFVGEPFAYVWWYATDKYGRSVAGDARIEYLGWTHLMATREQP